MRLLGRLGGALAACLWLLPSCGFAQAWRVAATWHIGGEGGWDYVTVDSASHRVFVTRGTHTQAIDGNSGKILGDIPGQIRSHGVALAPAVHRGFITDGGGSGAILIFDLDTYAILGKLAAMPDADGIIYDARLNRIFAVSGDGNALLTFKADIDPASGKVEAPIPLGGSPEFLTSDGSGKVYVNLQDKDVVAVVDVASRKVVARWPVAPGGAPVGMSVDAQHHRLFVGCRKPQKLIVMSSDDGKVLASLPIGAGVDATSTNGQEGFASCRDGSLSIAGEASGSYAIDQVVKTAAGARTMGLDASAHIIYLPTALFAEPPPGSAGGRPAAKPDSFMLLRVDQSAP